MPTPPTTRLDQRTESPFLLNRAWPALLKHYEFRGLALVTSKPGFWSIVHSTPRSASSAIFCNSAALALSGSARASLRYLSARFWFLSFMLKMFTLQNPTRNQRPSLSLIPALRVNSGTRGWLAGAPEFGRGDQRILPLRFQPS
jgi:hypothetical protein